MGPIGKFASLGTNIDAGTVIVMFDEIGKPHTIKIEVITYK